jgi:hypothetical protein
MLKEGFIVDIQHRSAKLAPLTIAEPNTLSNKAEHVSAEVKEDYLMNQSLQFLVLQKKKGKKLFLDVHQMTLRVLVVVV